MRKSKRSASTSPNTAKRVTTAPKLAGSQIRSAFPVPVCGLRPGLAQQRVSATKKKAQTTHEHTQTSTRNGQKGRGQNGGREVRRYLRHLATLHAALQ